MKTSAVLASMLFGSLAVAAPFDKRALVYTTEIVTETVVVWTTVYDDGAEVAQATTTPAGYFYEQPKFSSAAAVPTSAQAPAAPPAVVQPSSAAAPAPQAPTSTPAPAPAYTPAPSPAYTPAPVEQPKPETSAYVAPAPAPASSAAYVAPAPAASSPAAQQPSGGSSSGATYQNIDITVYDNNQGGSGACGTKLVDSDMIVALAKPTWGDSTYDRMTGAATNPWCGQKINVFYEGRTITATIMDLCPECKAGDIDLSVAAWQALTGSDVKTRLKASWSKAS